MDQLSSLISYVPPAVAQSIYTHPNHPQQPNQTTFRAAVLFADVSGFTPLAEALSQKGPRGAEELTRLLNQYFSRMISLIEQGGGAVVKFSGDAMTVVFSATNHPLPKAVYYAEQTAQKMQNAMQEFAQLETIAGPVTLAMKIGIGAGDVLAFHVGGVQDKWEYVIAGAPLRQVAEAEHQAERGQIILSEVAKKIRQGITTYPIQQPPQLVADLNWAELPASTKQQATAALHAYIPEIITSRLAVGQSGWLAELRRLTILFISVVEGLDYDDLAVKERLQTFTALTQQIILKYEGTINKIAVDDKGTILIGLFGAPPFAHEDDPQRAVQCALELQEAASNNQLQLAIGITTGKVFCGPVGSDTRREYTVMGDRVNLSARLMGVAAKTLKNKPNSSENGIRCDQETYQMATQQVQFDILPKVKVKGKSEPIAIFRPLEKKLATRTDQPRSTGKFVGRTTELNKLLTLAKRVTSSHRDESITASKTDRLSKSQIVLLEGEAGIGKSRLLQELRHHPQARNLTTYSGAASNMERNTPYRVWRDIFVRFFNLTDSGIDDLKLRQQTITRYVQDIRPDLLERLPLLNDILHVGFADNAMTRALDAHLRHEGLISLLIELMETRSKQGPLIVVLEDAHWLDVSSWALALEMARGLADCAFLMIISLRPLREDNIRIEYVQLKALSHLETLLLEPLQQQETTDLVAARLGVDTLPLELTDLVQTRAGGNPFFAEELAHTLENTETLSFHKQDGQKTCQVIGHLDELSMPDTIQGFVLARLDRLPPEAYLTLKVASVVGRSFSARVVKDIYPAEISDSRLQTYLDDLDYRDLTPRQSSGTEYNSLDQDDELGYYFKHIITQEVAYSTLLYSQRQQIHAEIAQWYEQAFYPVLESDNVQAVKEDAILHSALAPYLPLLAYHYSKADQPEKERFYARLAGQQATVQFANSEALAYFNRAIQLLGVDDLSALNEQVSKIDFQAKQAELFDLFLSREEIYHRLGDRQAQSDDLKALQILVEQAKNGDWQIRVQNQLARYHELTGDYPAARSAADKMLHLARQHSNQAVAGNSLNHLASIAWKEGNYEDARAFGEQSLVVFQAMHNRSGEALSLKILGNICHELGDIAGAQTHQQHALDLQRAAEDPYGEGASSINLGNSYLSQGNLVTAQKHYSQALTIFQAIGYRRGMAYASGSLGQIWRSLGDYDQAQQQFSQTQAILHTIGDRWGEAIGLHNLGMVYQDVGQFHLAKDYCQQALVIQRDLGDKRGEAFSLTYLGLALEGLQEWHTARDIYDTALLLRREIGQEAMAIESLAGLARVSLKQGHFEMALNHAQEISAWLIDKGTEGIEDPFRVCYTTYLVLQNTDKPLLAQSILAVAHHLLLERAENIHNPQWRQAFLNKVAINREIATAWHHQSSESKQIVLMS